MEGRQGCGGALFFTITLGEASRGAVERYRLQPVGRDCDLRDGDDIYRH